jgi:hypothetical protein
MDFGGRYLPYIQHGHGGFGFQNRRRNQRYGYSGYGFRRKPLQHGQGIGTFLSGLARWAMPALKQMAGNPLVRDLGSTLKNSALRGVRNLATDVLAGADAKQSLSNSLHLAKRDVAKTVQDHVGGDNVAAADPTTVVKRRVQKRAAAAAVAPVRRDRWQDRPQPISRGKRRVSKAANVFSRPISNSDGDSGESS